MKVALVNGAVFWGGGEKWFVTAGVFLKNKGHDVKFFGCGEDVIKKASEAGLDIEKFGFRSDVDFLTIWGLYRSFKKFKPDVVVFNAERDVRLGAPSAMLAGVKVRVHIKGISGIKNNRRYRFSYNHLRTHLLCVAEAVREEILNLGWMSPERVKTIHNGVDLTRFTPHGSRKLREEIGAGDSDLVVGAAARLSSIKGFEYLIEAMPYVLERFPSAKCVLAGKGRMEEMLKEKTMELKVEKAVYFVGFKEDVADVNRSLDIMVHPSVHTEGLPYSLLEAMACGKPAIGTPVAGIPEALIDGEMGLIVPLRDAVSLAKAIIRLGEDSQLRARMGASARKRVEEHFDHFKKMTEFEKWLVEIVNHAKSGE